MDLSAKMFIGTEIFGLVFVGLVAGFVILERKLRKERTPVKFKLLRGPGESLRRKLNQLDESFDLKMGVTAIAPVFAATVVFQVLTPFCPNRPRLVLGLTALVLLTGLIIASRLAYRRIKDLAAYRLGLLGEREVAEHLQPLCAKNYQVFHDVPAEGVEKSFNLDHVAVGPTGVALIETKTRRKGKARPGMKDHVVFYDGKQLIWPWGEDRHGLDQAKAEAAWLHQWIKQRTGIDTPVKPILALPGWWVEMKTRGEVTVVNSKSVVSAVEGKGLAILTDEQIEAIARQLDIICRDVVD